MNGVKTSHGLEGAQAGFEKLLNNLSNVLADVRPRTNILNTKLGNLKKRFIKHREFRFSLFIKSCGIGCKVQYDK